MASPTQWTWVWVSSRSWWWTGKPSMLQSMGPQRVRHDWAAELNWAYPFSSRYSWLRSSTRVSCIAGRFFTNWALKPSLLHTATLLSFLKKKVKRTQQRPSLTQCPQPLSCLSVFSFMEKKSALIFDHSCCFRIFSSHSLLNIWESIFYPDINILHWKCSSQSYHMIPIIKSNG